MKRLSINTQNNENGLTNNNGFQFPMFTGSTNPEYHSTSTNLQDNTIQYQEQENKNFYAICVDWIEFICIWENPIELAFLNNTNPIIIVEKISVHRNPNFRNLHRLYINSVEVCDIYSNPNNNTHAFNEVSVKVANFQLYTGNYYSKICEILITFNLVFNRMARIDLALDGNDILKLIAILNKYSKSHTIQISNDAIKILPTAFNKKELCWMGWSIGKSKSGISATVYDKTNEIIQSKKNYITDYWNKNGIKTESVGRFEIHLNNKRLKKYQLDLSSMKQLSDAGFVGEIFTNEVKSWLKFYRVLKRDMMRHKKEVAIKKGREIQYIKWDKIPTKMELLRINNHVSNRAYINARNTISFNLHEILLHPNTSTTAQTEIIHKYASDYQLQDYVNIKIRKLFGNELKSPYIEILKPLVRIEDNMEREE